MWETIIGIVLVLAMVAVVALAVVRRPRGAEPGGRGTPFVPFDVNAGADTAPSGQGQAPQHPHQGQPGGGHFSGHTGGVYHGGDAGGGHHGGFSGGDGGGGGHHGG